MSQHFQVSGQIVDIPAKQIYPGTIVVKDGYISEIIKLSSAPDIFICPGFIDAHVHVESSMLVPAEFARLAVMHGTVGTISDPHEIGNVLGVAGVKYMIENGRQVNFKFYFGAPSCVPATPFETAGAEITADDIESLFQEYPEITYLAEMMNWPGVLFEDPIVKEKIALAQKYGREVDGHAPGLKGEKAAQYAAAGITTDHECFTAEEALDKLKVGMKILIREGSAAKNFEALIDLLPDYADQMMFCSDDKHPDNLVESHINALCRRAAAKNIDRFKILQAACINPVEHYHMKVGLLKVNDPADFILLDNLDEFNVLATYINGQKVAENGQSLIPRVKNEIINNFSTGIKSTSDFALSPETKNIAVIEALDGQLITNRLSYPAKVVAGNAISDLANDVLKMTVVNRYEEAKPAIAFIKNFGLQRGAIASSVGHDSHNIIALGVDDESICRAVNLVIKARGGVSAVDGSEEKLLPLPVAGIMSAEDGFEVSKAYAAIDQMAKKMGSKLTSPFMSLSFMALLVIPSLKLSDKGLFDGDKFEFVSPFDK
ncbi:adenine deaminase [Penaeicola halotolerans]|uniref:adenine deaminase n=1 Tax=Penaeicola halotolerans TaxID=2793196 RepID=UPI001CF905A7|nr:adenine deaminase [Penaeicola halotolerans]